MTTQEPDRRGLQQLDRRDIQRPDRRDLQQADRRDLQQLLSDTLEYSDEAYFLHRLHCVFIVRKGVPASTVAEWFNYSPSTVSRWVSQFNKFGAEGLRDMIKPGRPKNLSSDQLNTLKKAITQSPEQFGYTSIKWSGKCLQTHLETCYSVSLSIRQCQRLLKQLKNDSKTEITETSSTKNLRS